MNTNFALNYRMQKPVGKSVIQKIIASGMSDIYIGEKVGVSRTSVYTWRTKKDPKIRLQNLKPLAELLNAEIDFSGDKIQFKDKIDVIDNLELNESINLESDMMTLNAEDIIKDLRSDKQDLRERIEFLKEENKALNATVESMSRNLETLNERISQNQITMPTLELDKFQNVVDLRAGTFVNISPLFAEKLGYSVFELVGQKWEVVIPPNDRAKWGVAVAQELLENEEKGIEEPCEVATEITEYDVNYLTKNGNILKGKCNTKKLSNIISMNEIEFLD